MTSFFWSTLLLVATGATARKEFSYDVILFWSTLLLVATGATGATARKEFSYDVILFRVLCYWFLQVLLVQQVATSLAVLLNFEISLPLLVTGLNHVKICLSSWFHTMLKLLFHGYFQHIVI